MSNISYGRIHEMPAIAYGKNLYILGTADIGPGNVPIRIYNMLGAKEKFGNIYAGTLIQAFNECYQVAGDSINYYLVRIFDAHSSLELKGWDYRTQSNAPLIHLTAKYAGAAYNDIYLLISKDDIIVMQENFDKHNMVYTTEGFKTIFELVNAINFDSRINDGLVIADSQAMHMPVQTIIDYCTKYGLLNLPLYLYNSRRTIEFTKNQLYVSLDEAYLCLEDQPIDILYVAGAYFDDVNPLDFYGANNAYGAAFYLENRDYLSLPHLQKNKRTVSFHEQLINFCKQQLAIGVATHGILGFSNPEEYSELILPYQPYLMKAAAATNFYDRIGLIEEINHNAKIDNGKFISVILGEFEYDHPNGYRYYNSAASGYAAYLAMSSKTESLTNTPIPNINGIRYHLDDQELISLGKLGVTTFRYSILKESIVCGNTVTAQIYGSPYCNVSNLRMIQTVICYMREYLNSYIGHDIHVLAGGQIIQRRLKEMADLLIEYDIIQDLKFDVKYDLAQSKVYLNIELLALNSLEYVSSSGEVTI